MSGSNGVSGSSIPPISREASSKPVATIGGSPSIAAIAWIGIRLVNASTMSISRRRVELADQLTDDLFDQWLVPIDLARSEGSAHRRRAVGCGPAHR